MQLIWLLAIQDLKTKTKESQGYSDDVNQKKFSFRRSYFLFSILALIALVLTFCGTSVSFAESQGLKRVRIDRLASWIDSIPAKFIESVLLRS